MSLFFEDVELNKQNEESVFVEDTTGLLSVTLESEVAWHNIEKTMMREEFKAVITESEQKLNAGKGNFFKTIAEFFDKFWKAVTEAIRNLTTKLSIQFNTGAKYVARKQKAISAYPGNKTAEIYDWKKGSGTLGEISKAFKATDLGNKLTSAIVKPSATAGTMDSLSQLLGYKNFTHIDKGIVMRARSSKRSPLKFDKGALNTAVADIKNAKAVLTELNKFASSAKSLVSQGKKSAKKGEVAVKAGDDTQQKIATASATTAKNATSVLNKLINVYTKLILERYSDALKMVKAAVGGAKEDEKGRKAVDKAKAKQGEFDGKKTTVKKKQAGLPAPEGEEEESTAVAVRGERGVAKTESLFDLTLEDFEDDFELDGFEEELDLDTEFDFELEDFEVEEEEELEEDFDLELEDFDFDFDLED
jgi:hypothetical protein